MKSCFGFCCAIALAAPVVAADLADLARSSGIQGGLVVHLGCGDGRETARLLLDDRFLVHGLEEDAAQLRQARANLLAAGQYGRIAVAAFDGVHLPYTDHLVNLLIDTRGAARVSREEILRVLVPGGVALVAGEKIVKPWPAEIDQWTHFLHGPDNNAVARDSRVDIPRSLQWVSEPRWGRSHEEMASMSAAVSAEGRLFAIVDEAPLLSIRFSGDWKLVARDAFNGTLLWKRDIPLWNDHLRHFRSGPAHLPRRLVAVGDRVYVTLGLAEPVCALDAATGETVRRYEGTERTEEILVDDGVLYLVRGTSEVDRRGEGLFARGEPAATDVRGLMAIETDSGRLRWQQDFPRDEFLLPLTLAVRGQRLYYQSTFGVVCLDAPSGQPQWRTPRPTPLRRMAYAAPTLVATDEVVLCADRDVSGDVATAAGTVQWGVHGWNDPEFPRKASCTLRAYAAEDGRALWSTPCNEGYNSPVDVFVIDDLAWVGTDFRAYDLHTGAVAKEINTKGDRVGMPHHRCYRDKATERMILTGRSGIEVLSLDDGWLCNNSWIRGTCQYGILPSNGLVYAPPDACACFLTVKVPGFYAAAPQRGETGHMPFPPEPVLETGALYGAPLPAVPHRPGDWPMYRHDAARSGAGAALASDALGPQWSVSIGGKLTQPVIAGNTLFVASVDTHTIHALKLEDGSPRWQYTAGARIDSAPTCYRGRLFFGSADGWVYCLGADDGRLAWRFRAAPEERLVNVYGQLESVWPVHGAVLIQNDTLYVTTGRTSYTDGGIVLYRLDPATGTELSRTMLYHLDPDTGKQLTSEARFNMEGTASDILSGDGESVFLKEFRFDRQGQRTDASRPHLWSITGFLGEEWFVRSYWIYGEQADAGWGGWANAANRYPSGRILCFDADHLWGYGRQSVANGPTGHRADAYHLFGMQRNAAAAPPVEPNRRAPRKKAAAKPGPLWSDPQSLIVRAMALAGDRLVLAGPPDVGQKEEELLAYRNEAAARAALEGRQGVFLRLVSAKDGSQITQCPLPAMPVFDGLAAAHGAVYLSLTDGRLLCLGSGTTR